MSSPPSPSHPGMGGIAGAREWDPTVILDPSFAPRNPYAVIILNTPLNGNAYRLIRQQASFVLCADGGANRLFTCMRQHGEEPSHLPDAVVGDLDSIVPEVRSHYAALGVDIHHVPEQLSTDFGKALRFVNQHRKQILARTAAANDASEGGGGQELQQLDLVVMGGLGGRLDQAIGQLQSIYRVSCNRDPDDQYYQDGDIYLVSDSSISFFIPPGRSYIYTSPRTVVLQALQALQPPASSSDHERDEQAAIDASAAPHMISWPQDHQYLQEASAVMPLGKPAVLTTRGFQWDVTGWESSFEGNISTSNHLRSEVICVDTSWWVLFTAELANRLKLWRE
ncbi:hypothetical protein KEM52_004795 [Ascosphaera acerosa]|nr:hypothetical protein KEM52_004795 [Ascosphaera acerosa]